MNAIKFIANAAFLLLVCKQLDALLITTCNCTQPKIRGLMDVERPLYCGKKITHDNVKREPTNYTIFMKESEHIEWQAWSCHKWVKIKTIIGSFWYGAFDTTYSHSTQDVSPEECRRMKKEKLCNKHTMKVVDGTSSSMTFEYIAEPAGEGKWYSTRVYEATNCFLQRIKLHIQKNMILFIHHLGNIMYQLKMSIFSSIIKLWYGNPEKLNETPNHAYIKQ